MRDLNILTVDADSKLIVKVYEVEKILKTLGAYNIHYNLGMDDFMGFTGYVKDRIVVRLSISYVG